MEKSTPASDSANTATFTVILVSIFVIEQITYQTGVPSKTHSTHFALRLHSLPPVAFGANQFRNRSSVEKVSLVFIVTVPAHVELVTTWCHKFRTSLVVCTSDPFLSFFRIFLGLCLLGWSHLIDVPARLRLHHSPFLSCDAVSHSISILLRPQNDSANFRQRIVTSTQLFSSKPPSSSYWKKKNLLHSTPKTGFTPHNNSTS